MADRGPYDPGCAFCVVMVILFLLCYWFVWGLQWWIKYFSTLTTYSSAHDFSRDRFVSFGRL